MKRVTQIAVVILTCILSSSVAAPKQQTHAVGIDNMKFDPADVTVNVGDSVEWTNNDTRDHTVNAKDGSFKSGNLGNGASYRYTFKKAGTFSYGCSLHPRMKGTITVNAP
jgi:plastocyanin